MDIKEQNDKAQELENDKSFVQAYEAYKSALATWPENYRALMGAGRCASQIEGTAAGIAYFKRAIELHPERPEPFIKIGMLQVEEDTPAALHTLSEGVSRFPDNQRLRSLEAKTKINLGSGQDQFDLDKELDSAKYSENVYIAALRAKVGTISLEDTAGYYGRICQVFKSEGSKIRYARSLISIKNYSDALRLLESASDKSSADILIGKAICRCGLGDLDEAQKMLDKYLHEEQGNHQRLSALLKFLDTSTDLEKATGIVRDLSRTHSDPGIDNLIAFSNSILPPKRALLGGDLNDDSFRLSEPGESRAVVLVFAGFMNRVGAVPFSLIDRYFAGHGIAVASFVDMQGYFFWRGVPSLGENFDASIATLKQKLDARDIDKIYTLGNSAGGTAAMVYGCTLSARRALSFSGPSDISQAFLEQHKDKRGRAAIHGLNNRLSEDQLNLRSWLEAQENRCQIHAYFCENEVGDRIQAENMSHLPEVTLKPLTMYSLHESIGSAIGEGRLLSEFETIVDEVGAR